MRAIGVLTEQCVTDNLPWSFRHRPGLFTFGHWGSSEPLFRANMTVETLHVM